MLLCFCQNLFRICLDGWFVIGSWIKPRRDAITEVLRQGVAKGEFRGGLDLDIVIDGFYGPIYYRLLVPYADLSNSYIDSLAMNLLRGIAAK
jgi:hypothetical protein